MRLRTKLIISFIALSVLSSISGIIGLFLIDSINDTLNGITRVADATGIPLDEHTAATTVEMRNATGIDQFDYAEKSARYAATGK